MHIRKTLIAALAVAIALNTGPRPAESSGEIAVMTPVDELEIATAEDSLEFYRDVEFYAWLDSVLEEEKPEQGGA